MGTHYHASRVSRVSTRHRMKLVCVVLSCLVTVSLSKHYLIETKEKGYGDGNKILTATTTTTAAIEEETDVSYESEEDDNYDHYLVKTKSKGDEYDRRRRLRRF